MKYKLKQIYPGSPKLGTIAKKDNKSPSYYNFKNEDEKECLHYSEIESYPKFWELVVEKDYEILELSLKRSEKPQIINIFDRSDEYIISLLNCNGNSIHSIKRLSDGEIFTIGDKIIYNEIVPTKLKIKSFQIFNNELLVHKDCTMNTNKLYEIQHIKQPLFTTEDGVDIFENDTIHGVSNDWKVFSHFTNLQNKIKSWGIKPIFSTKEKAEEYILLNKPCLSYNEVLKAVSIKNKNTFETLKDLVKSKIKQSV